MNPLNNPDHLKYDDDFLHFCFKAINKDFKDNSLRNFFISFLEKMSFLKENSLLFPIKSRFFSLNFKTIFIGKDEENQRKNKDYCANEEIFRFFLENYHFRYINELKFLKINAQIYGKNKIKSLSLIDNEGNFSKIHKKLIFSIILIFSEKTKKFHFFKKTKKSHFFQKSLKIGFFQKIKKI